MAKRGGKRAGAGRKPGSVTQRTKDMQALAEKALKDGVTPLDYMLGIMRRQIPEGADPAIAVAIEGMRFEAAKAAAPYVHPRLQAITHAGDPEKPVEVMHREGAKTVTFEPLSASREV